MKNFVINITVEVPYPLKFDYREEASSAAAAISRSLKKLRKEGRLHKKQITAGRISWQQLKTPRAKSECPDHPDGHHFIPCDEWPATCTCGKQETEV